MDKIKTIFNNSTYRKILSAFFVFLFIAIVSTYSLINEKNALTFQISEIENEFNELSDDYDKLSERYSNLQEKYSSLLVKYNSLNEEIENYKDQQATINDLNAKLEEMHSQYDTLESERDNLQKQVDAKKAEEERIAREKAAQQLAQQQENAGYGTVYWVSGGEVYHSTPNCSTLKRSTNIYSGSIAQSGKGRACKVCY